jgi:hypothetical protein
MENKKASYRDQRKAIQDRIGGAGEPGSPLPTTGTTAGGAAAPASQSGIPKPGADGVYDGITAEQYDALPKGAQWRKPGDPPGKYRIKP